MRTTVNDLRAIGRVDVTATTVISVTLHREQIISRGARRKNRKEKLTGSTSAALLDEQPIINNIDVFCRVIWCPSATIAECAN